MAAGFGGREKSRPARKGPPSDGGLVAKSFKKRSFSIGFSGLRCERVRRALLGRCRRGRSFAQRHAQRAGGVRAKIISAGAPIGVSLGHVNLLVDLQTDLQQTGVDIGL
jgi:hypothetical protein